MATKKEKTASKKTASKKTLSEVKKSKFALYWESRKEREPGLEIVDMRAVLR